MKNTILRSLVTLVILLSTNANFIDDVSKIKDNEAFFPVPYIIAKHGYPVETHYVTTKDGYILKLYRIPYGKKCKKDVNKRPVVLMMHGLLSSSYFYVEVGTDHALGYTLPDNCFDIWLGNSRGNYESQTHVHLSNTSSEFWNFSWHEMGVYDVPAMIDYILEKTGQCQLHYIGHSQGTTEFFVYASLNPEESKQKVKSMHAFAPMCFVQSVKTIVDVFISQPNNVKIAKTLSSLLGLYEMLPRDSVIANVISHICRGDPNILMHLCTEFLFATFGSGWENTNATAWISTNGHFPAGSALNQFLHFGQLQKSGKFQMFDHGLIKNLELYGQPTPPEYPVEKIQVPMYLYSGKTDFLSPLEDADTFANINPNVIVTPINSTEFNHFAFSLSNNVQKLLYNTVIERLKNDSKGMNNNCS